MSVTQVVDADVPKLGPHVNKEVQRARAMSVVTANILVDLEQVFDDYQCLDIYNVMI